jgi:4-carboxymuconolactone decarboxylase
MSVGIRNPSRAALAAVLLAGVASPAFSNMTELRAERGDAVIRSLNNGVPQRTLESMRQEFPFLAEATEA